MNHQEQTEKKTDTGTEDSREAKSHLVQQRMLAKWRAGNTVVEIIDVAGGRIVGIIRAFDQYVLHVEYSTKGNPDTGEEGYVEDIMVFKHAIRSIRTYRRNSRYRSQR